MDKDERPSRTAYGFGRLTRRTEFQRVSRGKRKASGAFTLLLARRDQSNPAASARIGFTVTRKVGNSVERNRIRRRLKEALRAAQPLEARADHDYVVMARREALSRRFSVLVEDFQEAFRALGRVETDGRRPAAQKNS